MASLRQNKVASLLQQDLGVLFQREAPGMGIPGMISVTVVRVSPDLGYAKVYLSIFGAKNNDAVLQLVRNKAAEFRFHLGKKIGKQVRVVPELDFFIDDSLDYAEKIDNLLKE